MTDATNYYPADHPFHEKQTATNDAVAGEPVIDHGEPRDGEPEMAENELEDDDIDLDDTLE